MIADVQLRARRRPLIRRAAGTMNQGTFRAITPWWIPERVLVDEVAAAIRHVRSLLNRKMTLLGFGEDVQSPAEFPAPMFHGDGGLPRGSYLCEFCARQTSFPCLKHKGRRGKLMAKAMRRQREIEAVRRLRGPARNDVLPPWRFPVVGANAPRFAGHFGSKDPE